MLTKKRHNLYADFSGFSKSYDYLHLRMVPDEQAKVCLERIIEY